MGFRLSFYNIPKTLADKVQTVKSDEELYSYEDDLKNEEMLYDTAYSLMSTFLNEDGKYISRLFNANLNIEEDCFYGKMDKEQFKNLIELAVRNVMDTEKKFKEFKDLKKRVIEAGINDINDAGVEFLVKATNNGRRGVKASHVEFELRKRTSITETEFDVVAHPEWIHRPI